MAENDLKLIQDVGGGVPRQRTIATLNAITDAASFKTALSIGSGTGDVTSVNGIPPVAGDVPLTAGDVGAFPSADAGTIAGLAAPAISDLAATTAVPHGPAPFEYNFFKVLSGDLTLTDDGTPNEGDGYRLVLTGDSTARLITIPSSFSGAQGGNITTFYVLPNQEVTIVRQYINSGWKIWGDPAPAALSQQISSYQGLGGTAMWQTMEVQHATTAVALSDTNLFIQAIYINRTATLTGLRWFQTSNSSFTADANNKVGLYSYSAGTITLIASSANAALTWDVGQNVQTGRTFVTPVLVHPGTYYIAALYNSSAQTTAPSIAGAAAAINAAIFTMEDFTNGAKIACFLTGQSDLPATESLANFTAHTGYRWFRLY